MNENRSQLNYMIICTVKYLYILSSHVKLWDMEIIYKQKTNKMHIFLKINTHSNLCGLSNANELKKNAHIKKI